MKKQVLLILALIILNTFATIAHSGRTDSNGGHYNRRTGNYHSHSGGGGFAWVVIIGGIIVFLMLKSGSNKK
jgi:hypothetical protein